ncbi:hypothetical protein GCM10009623_30860 [Nocardioides aestuarii]|uniref:NUDIX hydrolase n=1 Tax=Nocardioides aestuarii TaxID=252231 RepID=A0ABW4TQN9_9ACTN
MSAVTPVELVTSTPAAPWLSDGSTAEVWAGTAVEVPDPCIIVSLLLPRTTSEGHRFFCVPTARGLDLPTKPLGPGPGRVSVDEGLAQLVVQTLGHADVDLACVGYVRNVVPVPDATYPHPTPWAHVPVFEPTVEVDPVVTGSWVSLDDARPELRARHWRPIVEHRLEASAAR